MCKVSILADACTLNAQGKENKCSELVSGYSESCCDSSRVNMSVWVISYHKTQYTQGNNPHSIIVLRD